MNLAEAYRIEKRAAWYAMIGVALVSILSSFCLLAMPLYLFQVYDRVLSSRSIETLRPLPLSHVLCLLPSAFLIHCAKCC